MQLRVETLERSAGFGFDVPDEPAVPDVPAVDKRGREDDAGRFAGECELLKIPARSAGRAEGAIGFVCFGFEELERCWLVPRATFRRFWLKRGWLMNLVLVETKAAGDLGFG